MLEKQTLAKVLGVDEFKCVNCHACISVCPVKYCNNAEGSYVTVNSDMCIACGTCIDACTHKARYYIDDFDHFMANLKKGKKIIAIVAPSVAANFHDTYLQLNTWLKNINVEAIFDVSFGAELTVKSYLNYIETKNPQTVIAQPCAAIVTYIELYKPELIKYLAPVDSPMLHAMKMILEYYPQYRKHEIAVISPCGAKKREFEATRLGNYNVAYQSIARYLENNNINLSFFAKTDYDNPKAERAVLFSSPGGLLETVARYVPDIYSNSRKIEGVHTIYNYLDSLPQMIKQGAAPLLVDCLSCEMGCNAGPFTMNRKKSPDEVEFWVKKRTQELKEYYKSFESTNESINEIVEKFWKYDLYNREYSNRWENVLVNYPNEVERQKIYENLLKKDEKDVLNCSSCGYSSCEKMAVAIFNKLNKVENCHLYLQKSAEISHLEEVKSKNNFQRILETSVEGFVQVDTKGFIVNANPAMRKMLKKNDLIGRNLSEFLDDINQRILEQQDKLREQNIKATYELNFTQSDGGNLCCLVSGAPLVEEGKNIGSFALITDISKLKIAEEELKKANDELEEKVIQRTHDLQETLEEVRQQGEELMTQSEMLFEQERKLNDILQLIPDPILVINQRGEVLYWNKAIELLTGVTSDEILGKGNYQYSIPFYGERRKMLIDWVFEGDDEIQKNDKITKQAGILRTEIRIENFREREVFFSVTATSLVNSDEELIGAIEIIRDVTEAVIAEQEIKKAHEEVMQKTLILADNVEELKITNEVIAEINSDLEEKQNELAQSERILQKKNKHITDSIQYASRIQRAVLPTKSTLEKYLTDFFVLFMPKDIVSGDFYWINKRQNKLFLAVADCTGHGVPGAFMSMLGVAFLNEIVNSYSDLENITASYVLNQLRTYIKTMLQQEAKKSEANDGMDIAFIIIDKENMEVEYAGAHNPLVIIRNGELTEHKADKMPIGIFYREKESFTNNVIDLQKEDILYLYSDGYADQDGEETGRKFMSSSLKTLFTKISHLPMDQQREILENEHIKWRGTREQVDDILILGFKI